MARTGRHGLVARLAITLPILSAGVAPNPAYAATLSIAVSGNHLVDGNGQVIQLRGVNRSGAEYACIQGWGIFDGPSDAASVQAIASWHTNAVRVPLNEDCWLNINMGTSPYGGSTYQAAIVNYFNLLHANGLYAILDLHWNAPGTQQATGQQAMVDADHGPAFWTSVATTFKADPAVLFDLYNEPEFISWSCWLNGQAASGSTCPVNWAVAGMQTLVSAVRAAGATQPIMVGGVAYANDLSGWLANDPLDPQHALVASLHTYNFNTCKSTSCWTSQDAPVAAQVPLVTGEIGEDDGGHGFIDSFMAWADPLGISYLAWTWDTWGCGNSPVLISDYSGTPCQTFGAGYQAHLAQLAPPVVPVGRGVESEPGLVTGRHAGRDQWHRIALDAVGQFRRLGGGEHCGPFGYAVRGDLAGAGARDGRIGECHDEGRNIIAVAGHAVHLRVWSRALGGSRCGSGIDSGGRELGKRTARRLRSRQRRSHLAPVLELRDLPVGIA